MPEGYKLPEDVQAKILALPPEEQAMAHAMALWCAGWSLRKAATEAGIRDHTTLWRRVQNHEAQRQRAKVRDVVEPLALSLADEAGRQSLEELHSGTNSMPAPVIFGIAVDKLQRLHQMDQRTDQAPLSQLFELLHSGGRLTVEGPDTSRTTLTSASPSPTERPPSHDISPPEKTIDLVGSGEEEEASRVDEVGEENPDGL
jgi:hypothetical protein